MERRTLAEQVSDAITRFMGSMTSCRRYRGSPSTSARNRHYDSSAVGP